MTMTMRTIPAGKFKSQCLALLDEVAQTGAALIVTKRGRPVAKVVPVEQVAPVEGSVLHCGDILSPAIPESDWEMLRP